MQTETPNFVEALACEWKAKEDAFHDASRQLSVTAESALACGRAAITKDGKLEPSLRTPLLTPLLVLTRSCLEFLAASKKTAQQQFQAFSGAGQQFRDTKSLCQQLQQASAELPRLNEDWLMHSKAAKKAMIALKHAIINRDAADPENRAEAEKAVNDLSSALSVAHDAEDRVAERIREVAWLMPEIMSETNLAHIDPLRGVEFATHRNLITDYKDVQLVDNHHNGETVLSCVLVETGERCTLSRFLPNQVRQLKRLLDVSARLQHRHSLPIQAVFKRPPEAKWAWYVQSPWCESSLRDWLDSASSNNDIPNGQPFNLLLGLLQAIEFLHVNGVIHGHLTPDNVLIRNGEAVLTGLEHCIDISLAMSIETKRVLVTRYAGPELLQGESPSKSSDMFAVGKIIEDVARAWSADRQHAHEFRLKRSQSC